MKLKYRVEQQKIDRWTAEQEEMQFTPALMELIQKSMEEISKLDRLMPGLIKLMREELELPFDEENYRRIVEENQQRQADYFKTFMTDVGDEN